MWNSTNNVLHFTDEDIDFVGTSATLTFSTVTTSGDTACANIPIIEDESLECSQDFSVAISTTSLPAILSTQSEATVIIVDDDCKCCIVFLSSSAIYHHNSP